MSEELDLLGFDPSQLSVFAPKPASQRSTNPLIYYTRPEDSKSEDGIYRSTIRFVYDPFNIDNSIIEVQSYALRDADGFFEVPSSLTINDKSCPIFKAFCKSRFAMEKDGTFKTETARKCYQLAAKKENGGDEIYQKRFARYVTVQIIKDENQPELEGRYMFWKMPKDIWTVVNNMIHPAKEDDKAAIPVLDFLFGRAVKLKVSPGPDDPLHPERKKREVSYTCEISAKTSPCTNPDKSSLLTPDEEAVLKRYVDAMDAVWTGETQEERDAALAKVNADPNTVELRKIYKRVLNEIKKFCPDVVDELGYKPWDPVTAARVQKWIDIALTGVNPAGDTTTDAPATAAPAATSTATVEQSAPVAPVATEPDDDLPF